jgi:hypothetical protein
MAFGGLGGVRDADGAVRAVVAWRVAVGIDLNTISRRKS